MIGFPHWWGKPRFIQKTGFIQNEDFNEEKGFVEIQVNRNDVIQVIKSVKRVKLEVTVK
jgi:hypothetical protein